VGDSISVPLVKSGKTIGALVVSRTHEDDGGGCAGESGERGEKMKVTSDDIILLHNLAAQISTALENAALRERMEINYFESIASLAAAVEARDRYTRGHSRRVSEYSAGVAKVLGLGEKTIRIVRDAGLLHDIGKIGIPDKILHSPSPSLPSEWVKIIRKHPEIGENIIKPMKTLRRLCPAVRHHHESYDGSGYPDGLSGKSIPLEARIMAVADAYDAMTSERSYRKSLSHEEAVRELVSNSGSQFDPECVDAFLKFISEKGVPGTVHHVQE
jgi:putative nucleotidyltransferase with HDIG domain